MLLATIRERFRDRITLTTYTDPVLDRLISDAVRYYSRFAPRIATQDLVTVADQAEYTLDSDTIIVTDCEWWPSGEPTMTDVIGPVIYHDVAQRYATHAPADRFVDEINRQAAEDRLRGEWEQRNRTTLILYPTPTTDDLTIAVTYSCLHVLNDGGTGYDTIPGHHLEPLVDLVVAEHLLIRAVSRVDEPDYTSGFSKVTKSHMPVNLRQEANALKTRARRTIEAA
jgi:hypothetical protein